MSTTSQNNETRFVVTGTTQQLRNADRRRQLAQGSLLLNQFRDVVLPLKAASEAPEDLIEGPGILFDWMSRLRERLESGGKPYRQFPTGSFDDEGHPIVEIRKATR